MPLDPLGGQPVEPDDGAQAVGRPAVGDTEDRTESAPDPPPQGQGEVPVRVCPHDLEGLVDQRVVGHLSPALVPVRVQPTSASAAAPTNAPFWPELSGEVGGGEDVGGAGPKSFGPGLGMIRPSGWNSRVPSGSVTTCGRPLSMA